MIERYNRQEMIDGWMQQSLTDGSVLVLGAGTTGNEVIKNLALLGVGHITIVDKDVVEEVNLSRCVLFRTEDIRKPKAEVAAQRAAELNPLIHAVSWGIDIVSSIGCLEYRSFHCVILTVDNLKARMWVNRYCWQNSVPLINTGIEGWTGNVFVMLPSSDTCIECSWTKREYQRLSEEHSCSKIGLVLDERKIPMVITSAAIAGSLAVQEAVKIIQKREIGPPLERDCWWFDGEFGAFRSWKETPKAGCAHHDYRRLVEADIFDEVSISQTVVSVKEKYRASLHCTVVEIKHDREIVYSISCRQCKYSQTIKPTLLENYRRFPCPNCGFLETLPDELTEELKDGFTFSELAVPVNHLLRISYDQDNTVRTAWIATKQ
jgi:molybdopterin/thiamine biosynthesis adenylyltransferase